MCGNGYMRRALASGLASCALLLHQRTVAAQSSSAIAHARFSVTSVHQYVPYRSIPPQLASPPNLLVPPLYRALIDSMLRESATFRRQCMRIAGEPHLVVRLAIGMTALPPDVRAVTQIRRSETGQLLALVDIGRHQELAELIAHELEHVIEQLDGIDLAARAALPHTGVTAVGSRAGAFETTRAKRAGLKVVSELRP
jgi:hypothetical protein